MKRVLITGADGFLGRNLRLHLAERSDVEVLSLTRNDGPDGIERQVARSDWVFHFAGVNRPQDPAEFVAGNVDLTRRLATAVAFERMTSGRIIPVVFASSTQAAMDNDYGKSKRGAEQALFEVSRAHGIPVHVYRLPNVFGKWCRPNYNSAVATFCHNVARGLPIEVRDASAPLTLVYVDDVLERFVGLMDEDTGSAPPAGDFGYIVPMYRTTVGAVAEAISAFRAARGTLTIDRVGTGLIRALYATYVSYLPVECFAYDVPAHRDSRGVFVEMLKTPDAGQFSYFTAGPGVTRGGHYHHSKTEKFLVIHGQARFRFRHMQSGEVHELHTTGQRPQIVETVPGWTHDITNTGSDEMVVMLWANEVYNHDRPDTYRCAV